MKLIKQQLLAVSLSLLMVLGLAAAPVGAEHGGATVSADSTTTTATSTTSTDTSVSGSTSTTSGRHSDSRLAANTETENQTETNDTTDDNGGLQSEARDLLASKRQNGKQHSTEQRQQACAARQQSIDTRTTNWGTAAQRHLDVFNAIFTKVQAFQASKQLNVANYDTLVAAATAKQATAQSAVDALKALNVQIDCTQTDPANSVATIKAAVDTARTSLQAYRSAIKDLIVALKGASTAQTSTSTDTTTTTTTGGTN